jgi:hypothetical protein
MSMDARGTFMIRLEENQPHATARTARRTISAAMSFMKIYTFSSVLPLEGEGKR